MLLYTSLILRIILLKSGLFKAKNDIYSAAQKKTLRVLFHEVKVTTSDGYSII